MDKVIPTAAEAADIPAGAAIAVGGFGISVGGFGISGIPAVLIDALAASRIHRLEVFSNNCGTDRVGLGKPEQQTDPPNRRVLHRREQGIRPPIPGR
jgi:3-oxoacid CoA-transferase subunit A